MDCKAYLYESLTNPGAFVVPGFENIMPDMRKQLSEDQIWAVIAYLQSQGGEVTVTAADIPKAPAGGAPAATAGPALTPEIFARTISSTAFPNPGARSRPLYQASVGFDDLDHAMVDDVALAWWRDGWIIPDRAAPEPSHGALDD